MNREFGGTVRVLVVVAASGNIAVWEVTGVTVAGDDRFYL